MYYQGFISKYCSIRSPLARVYYFRSCCWPNMSLFPSLYLWVWILNRRLVFFLTELLRINFEMFMNLIHSYVCVCVFERDWQAASSRGEMSSLCVCRVGGRVELGRLSQKCEGPYIKPRPAAKARLPAFDALIRRTTRRHSAAALKPQKCNLCFHRSARLIGGSTLSFCASNIG